MVLLFTGNAFLTTDASVISDSPVPNAVRRDVVRQGALRLLPGQAASTELLWMIFPFLLSLYVSSMVLGLKAANPTKTANTFVLLRSLIKKSVSTTWENQNDTLMRLLRHGNRFAPISVTIGLSLTAFYCILAGLKPNYECSSMWEVGINGLGQTLFPWPQDVTRSEESITQWIFVFFAMAMQMTETKYFGPESEFCADKHIKYARRVYQGMGTIVGLRQCSVHTYKCLDNWCVNALSVVGLHDYVGRRNRTRSEHCFSHLVYVTLFYALQFPAALVISWPSLLFSLSQNVASDNVFLVVCRTSIVAVILMEVMKRAFLESMVKVLARIYSIGQITDILTYNNHRCRSYFVIQFLAYVMYPAVATFLIDGVAVLALVAVVDCLFRAENCCRLNTHTHPFGICIHVRPSAHDLLCTNVQVLLVLFKGAP